MIDGVTGILGEQTATKQDTHQPKMIKIGNLEVDESLFSSYAEGYYGERKLELKDGTIVKTVDESDIANRGGKIYMDEDLYTVFEHFEPETMIFGTEDNDKYRLIDSQLFSLYTYGGDDTIIMDNSEIRDAELGHGDDTVIMGNSKISVELGHGDDRISLYDNSRADVKLNECIDGCDMGDEKEVDEASWDETSFADVSSHLLFHPIYSINNWFYQDKQGIYRCGQAVQYKSK